MQLEQQNNKIGIILTKNNKRKMEQLLVNHFSDRFRRIWVQYSKFSTCITLFPIDRTQSYRFVTAPRKIQVFEELVQLINDKA